MPAIQPARLRQQAALLAQSFSQPEVFIRSLHHLLESYADIARHPGQGSEIPPLIDAFYVRPPVLRQLVVELTPYAQTDSEGAIVLAEALWQQPYLEFRQLAASLLGLVPVEDPQPILALLESWLNTRPEDRLIEALLVQGMFTLRRDRQEIYLEVVSNWLKRQEVFANQLALRALTPLIQDPGFENIPSIFRIIQPFSRSLASGLRPFMVSIMHALARRSPQETAFFLRYNLETPENPDTPWLVRQTLPALPFELQESLHAALRSASAQTPRA
jgi:DNA alkylation repair enzyme